MADVEIFRDTNEKIAHHPGMKPFLRYVAARVASNAQMLLDTRSEVRTGDSMVHAESGKLDGYVYITDRNSEGTSDKIAAIISYQHNILWDAVRMGF